MEQSKKESSNTDHPQFKKSMKKQSRFRKRNKFSSKNKTFYDLSKIDPSGQLTAFIVGIPIKCTKNDVLAVLRQSTGSYSLKRFELIGKKDSDLNMGFGSQQCKTERA